MTESLTLSPTGHPRTFRAHDGTLLTAPPGWVCVPPGDPGLTRRVKALGPSWTVVEKKGRKLFSHGVWVPAASLTTAQSEVQAERATPAYQRRRAQDAERRAREQSAYESEFYTAVLTYLRFSVPYGAYARALALAVTEHATPVGSGTVARTERIPLDERVEAAVIAWMRHQTTAYDSLEIARIKGERRRVRAELAAVSRRVLDEHRTEWVHDPRVCPLCMALVKWQSAREES